MSTMARLRRGKGTRKTVSYTGRRGLNFARGDKSLFVLQFSLLITHGGRLTRQSVQAAGGPSKRLTVLDPDLGGYLIPVLGQLPALGAAEVQELSIS